MTDTRPLVVGYDGRPGSHAALDQAIRLAGDLGAPVVLVGGGEQAVRRGLLSLLGLHGDAGAARPVQRLLEHRAPALGDRGVTVPQAPVLAGVIAELADAAAARGLAAPPHVLRPLYVRRPDAELARDRARAALSPEV